MSIIPLNELKRKVHINTGFFETNQYTEDTQMPTVSGNFDGAGLSAGNLQYNYGPADRAQELFSYMVTNYPDLVAASFGTYTAEHDDFVNMTNTMTRSERISWGESKTDWTNDPDGRLLFPPWEECLDNLLMTPECIAKYNEMADVYYWPDAYDLFRQLRTTSRASLASLYDLNVNRGRFYPINTLIVDFEQIEADDVNFPTEFDKEAERIRIINVRGNDRTNAMSPESAEWFVQRRECQGNQGGTYYGDVYDPEPQFDITQDPATHEKTDDLGVKLGSIDVSNVFVGTTPIQSLYLGATLLGNKAEQYTTTKVPQTQFRTNEDNYAGIGGATEVTLNENQPLWVDVQNWVAAKTYYTTDGTTPTTNSAVYHENLTFTESCTLKTLTVSLSGVEEAVKTLTVNVTAATASNWRYLRITPDTMNGHWQCAEIEIFDRDGTNRALVSSGSFTPPADGTNTFGAWAGLKNEDTTSNAVYWSWGYELEINVDLGANYDLTSMDFYLGSSTTNPDTGSVVLLSEDNTNWISGKVTKETNPSTYLQRYTITA